MIMRALLAAAALAVAVVSAQAADYPGRLPTKAPEADLFNWQGLYIGGHAGYAKDKFSAAGVSDSPAGFEAGVHGGYRWQLGNFVPGIEVDITAGDVSGNTATVVTDSAKLWGTVRGTLGYSFTGFMPYVTAGYAWQRGEIGLLGFTDTQTHNGWVYGGGIASPITPHLIAKIEYLHYDLGDKTYTIPLGSASVSSRKDEVRAGLEYKF